MPTQTMQPKIIKFLLKSLIVCLLLLNSCNTTLKANRNPTIQLIEKTKAEIVSNAKSFEGKPKSMLLKNWGTPKSITTDGQGGEIYYYNNSTTINAGTLAFYINIFINKDGIVNRTDVKHLLF